jgi:methionine sulfoxide reductase heme-binding subunit
MSGPDPFDYFWWLASRSAGLVAFALLTAVTVLGLLSVLRVAGPKTAKLLRPWHERFALAALACIGAHGLFLLFDGWLKPGVTGILVPFTMGYRPLWTGLGIIGAYVIAALSLSFYVRRRIGASRWRNAHRLAPVGFVLIFLHVLMAGTDARTVWLLAMAVGAMIAVGLLLGLRIAKEPRQTPTRSRRPAVSSASASQPQPVAAASRARRDLDKLW